MDEPIIKTGFIDLDRIIGGLMVIGALPSMGKTSFGSCPNSPHGKHEHITDYSHSAFCGSTSYGSCSNSPHGKHER